jgi:hypothetical protein
VVNGSALRIPHFAPPRANSLSKQAIMISDRNSIVKPFLSTVVLARKEFRLFSAETHRPDGAAPMPPDLFLAAQSSDHEEKSPVER